MIAAAAASIAPASSSLLRRSSASRRLLLLLLHRRRRLSPPLLFHCPPPPLSSSRSLRLFCSKTLATAASDVDAGDKTSQDSSGEVVREFKKRVRIVDVKGGPDQGLDRLGQKLSIRGWVRTCRIQSSVTFIEVNDGSCLSNMQCVMGSDAEGYDQVEAGIVATGASILVDGIIVSSQGTKQKVELKVERLVMIGKSDPAAYPIQKKRVSREFLRSIAHLRPRSNTFGAV